MDPFSPRRPEPLSIASDPLTPAVRVLHLEDCPLDARLVYEQLAADGLEVSILRVDNEPEFEAALLQETFDLIISDYNLPGYDGVSALKRARAARPDTPVIIVSGTVGEDEAVKCLHVGATDYLLKSRLDRLVPAVKRALEEAEARRQRKATEAALVQREQTLRDNEDRTNFAMAAARMGIWEVDIATGQLTWSPTMAVVFGLSAGWTPTSIEGFLQLIHPDDRSEVRRAVFGRFPDDSSYAVEFRAAWPDRSIHWIYGHAQVARDASGEPRCIRGVAIDITAKKALESQLLQSQKMEAIGQLAGGIAHDFNNLLTVINGTADLALESVGEGGQVYEDLHDIRRAGERASGLTHQLLAFSRKQLLQPQVLNLDTVVGEIETLIRRLVGEHIQLVVTPAGNLGSIKADRGQLEQVIANLVVNARDAMPDGGRLHLETRNVDVDEAFARNVGIPLKNGPHVQLSIADTGVGMDEQTRERIFEPFFTTKGPGKGTGLGLSTVYGIVKQSTGFIWVSSAVGEGTTFNVCIPRVVEEPDVVRRHSSSGVRRGHETLLLVEDLRPLALLAKRMLESAGYKVLIATSGEEAMTLLTQYAEPVQLVISDVVMPGMNGPTLGGLVASSRPGTKVLYMSGYSDDVIVRRGVLERGMPFLSKPFSADSLTGKVREVLDSDA